MGKLLILTKYIFLIYGSDIKETRRHIHVTYANRGYKQSCKFWLEPQVILANKRSSQFNKKELREIENLIHEHIDTLMSQLNKFYRGQPTTAIRL